MNNRKICGILIEFLSYGNIIEDIVIGIGVNINNKPKKLEKTTTCLKEHSAYSVENIELTEAILKEVYKWIRVLNKNKNVIVKEWMKRSARLNSKIKFNYNNQIIKGIYKGGSSNRRARKNQEYSSLIYIIKL